MNTQIATNPAPIIRLQGIQKAYGEGEGRVLILKGLSFDIGAGESVAIMGTSGSGKSTLMNIIGCLDKPTAGEYYLEGRPVSQLTRDELAEVRNHTLGFVFQNFNLLPRTTALENVELPLVYGGVPRAERSARAAQALALVGLGERMHHRPNQLSGGQQQRVAIARALVGKPRVILADEPTGNLDSHTSIEVMQLFQTLVQSGITVVLVTHEPDIARYASRVLVMRDGQLVEDTRQKAMAAVVSQTSLASEATS